MKLSRPDNERALQIYKTFTAQTEDVLQFLDVAARFEAATHLEIPSLQHASTDLTHLLEDDLNDADVERRHREYLEGKEATDRGSQTPSTTHTSAKTALASKPMPSLPKVETESETQAPLLDLFESIESPQILQMSFQAGQQQQRQQSGFYPQQSNFEQQPLLPQQAGFPQPVDMGSAFSLQASYPLTQPLPQVRTTFGSYSPQLQSHGLRSSSEPISQNNIAMFPQLPSLSCAQPLQPHSTNPFRQRMIAPSPTGTTVVPGSLQRPEMDPFDSASAALLPQREQSRPPTAHH